MARESRFMLLGRFMRRKPRFIKKSRFALTDLARRNAKHEGG